MKRRPLPPFGVEFSASPVPRHPFVAMGPKAWAFAVRCLHARPTMVLPEDRDPLVYHWPVAGRDVVLIELGSFNTDRLERFAYALLRDGALMVYPIRDALLAQRATAWPIFVKDDPYVRQTA